MIVSVTERDLEAMRALADAEGEVLSVWVRRVLRAELDRARKAART
jgi:hypothetical protein